MKELFVDKPELVATFRGFAPVNAIILDDEEEKDVKKAENIRRQDSNVTLDESVMVGTLNGVDSEAEYRPLLESNLESASLSPSPQPGRSHAARIVAVTLVILLFSICAFVSLFVGVPKLSF